MLFLEEHARLLLVVHAVLGAGTVAVSTHLFLWTRKWSDGKGRGPGVRWFAVVGLGLYALQFALGNMVYPVYKVHVRAEYLDHPSAIAEEQEVRQRAAGEIRTRAGVAPAEGEGERLSGSAIARLFDIKEHAAAIGLPLLLAAALFVFGWDPRKDPSRAARWFLFVTTGGTALGSWTAALIGIYVSAVRAIG